MRRPFTFLMLLVSLVGCTTAEPALEGASTETEEAPAAEPEPRSSPGPSSTTVTERSQRTVTRDDSTCPGGVVSEVDLDDWTAPDFPEQEGAHSFELPETTMSVQVEVTVEQAAGEAVMTLAWNGEEIWRMDQRGIRSEQMQLSVMGAAPGARDLSTPAGGTYDVTWSATGVHQGVTLALSATVCAQPVIPA